MEIYQSSYLSGGKDKEYGVTQLLRNMIREDKQIEQPLPLNLAILSHNVIISRMSRIEKLFQKYQLSFLYHSVNCVSTGDGFHAIRVLSHRDLIVRHVRVSTHVPNHSPIHPAHHPHCPEKSFAP